MQKKLVKGLAESTGLRLQQLSDPERAEEIIDGIVRESPDAFFDGISADEVGESLLRALAYLAPVYTDAPDSMDDVRIFFAAQQLAFALATLKCRGDDEPATEKAALAEIIDTLDDAANRLTALSEETGEVCWSREAPYAKAAEVLGDDVLRPLRQRRRELTA